MHKTPFVPVKVLQWTSKTNYKEYIFDHTSTDDSEYVIKQALYRDDTIDTALNKISVYLEKKQAFYAWSGNNPIIFDIKNGTWKGYKVNPFLSTDQSSDELKEPILYEYKNKDLFKFSTINIVFTNDLPVSLQKNKYYFSDLKFQPAPYYTRNSRKLSLLRETNTSNVKIMDQYYSRIRYCDKVSENLFLGEIFDNMNASKHIDMIQWIDDQTKVLYKLSNNHKIRQEYFISWTNVDKIDKVRVIYIYSILGKSSYCRVSIDQQGNIFFDYIVNNKEFFKLKDIDSHKKMLVNQIQSYIHGKFPIKLKEFSLNSKIQFNTRSSFFKDLAKVIGEYIEIFHVVETKSESSKQFLTVIYKRSSNYDTSSTVYDYIKSQINAGISKTEIMEMLSSLGVTGNLSEMINTESDMMKDVDMETKQIKIQNNGTIATIYPYSQGYEISIVNSANIQETNFLVYWLSRIIASTVAKQDKTKPTVVLPMSPEIQPNISSISNSINSASSASSQDSVVEFDFSGGAKQKTNYLLDRLQKADQNLFSDNYARFKCQSQEQPIVLSEEEKQYIESTNQAHYDNIVGYVSDSRKMNYYACPRLWCPKSNVPLSVDDPDAKCPENEEPMQFYWANDKNKKRYVKLIKPKDGLSFPCCKKRDPGNQTVIAEDATQNAVQKKNNTEINDNENYLMNHAAPIDNNRFGTIPEYLHKLMFKDKNISFDTCSKVLHKTHACIVRKGIANNKHDSFVVGLVEVLNFKSKKDFVKDIRKKLDLLKFISLNNGMVCKSFMNIREILPENNVSLQKEFENFKKKEQCNLNTNKSNLSRSLNIFKAYQSFLQYISSNDTASSANPVFFYDLIKLLYNIHVVIWEKDTQTEELFFICPTQTLMRGDFNPKVAMFVKDGIYYEPLVSKMRNSKSDSLFYLNDHIGLKNVVLKCNSSKEISSNLVFQNLYTLYNWTHNNKSLKNSEMFKINKVFINDNLTIDKLMTNGGILLTIPQIGITFLPQILDMNIDHKNVVFYTDVVDTTVSISVLKRDLSIYLKKCDDLAIKIFIGKDTKPRNENEDKYYTSIVFKKENLTKDMIIHSNTKNDFYTGLEQVEHNSKRWLQLQKKVARTILKTYNNQKLNELNRLPRETKINTLKTLFNNIPEKATIQIILEEMPSSSVENIMQWLSNVIVFTKYSVGDTIVQKNKNAVFGQNALYRRGIFKIPKELINNLEIVPNKTHSKLETGQFDINQIQDQSRYLPTIFIGSRKKLPTKWTMQKKNTWNKFVYIQGEYNHNTIPLFIKWFSRVIGLKQVTYDDILNQVFSIYFKSLDNELLMSEFLSDNSFKKEWLSKLDRSITSVKMLSRLINDLPKERKISILNEIMSDGKLYPTKLTFAVIADLLNISILLINRGDYGKFDQNKARNDVQNLKISSNFFQAHMQMHQRPVLIFYADGDKDKMMFYPIIDNSKKDKPYEEQLYMSYEDTPEHIKILIREHNS
jgi:hypothetical protein